MNFISRKAVRPRVGERRKGTLTKTDAKAQRVFIDVLIYSSIAIKHKARLPIIFKLCRHFLNYF